VITSLVLAHSRFTSSRLLAVREKRDLMTVRKAIYQRQEDAQLFIGDVIEHQSKLWLVPEWLEGPKSGTLRPARIVCTDDFGLANAGQMYQCDYFLTVPLSRNILEGRAQFGCRASIEAPDIVLNEETDFFR
jgi:hypothetical protein